MPTLISKNIDKISEATREANALATAVNTALSELEAFGVSIAENELYSLVNGSKKFIEDKLMDAMADEQLAGFTVSKQKKLSLLELPPFEPVEEAVAKVQKLVNRSRHGTALTILQKTSDYSVEIKDSYLDSVDAKYSTIASTPAEEELYNQASAFRDAFDTFQSYLADIGVSEPTDNLNELINPVSIFSKHRSTVA